MKHAVESSARGRLQVVLLSLSLLVPAPVLAQSAQPATYVELKQRAEAGHGWSQLYLGAAYHNGVNGAPRDIARAARWYQRAAGQGIPFAQYNLGVMYSTGNGVEQDHELALHWLEKAASFLAEAQYLTGVAYAEGRGTEVTTWKAREFLQRAVAGGSENAVKYLSTLR